MLHVFMSGISFYKSVKYSYFWSFSEFGEENKMCLNLNFTAHRYFNPTPNSKWVSYNRLHLVNKLLESNLNNRFLKNLKRSFYIKA